MEIADLVNTIEGLTEEQTVEIVARAEKLAEEQVDDLPRRKGARTPAAPPAEPVAEGATVEAADGRAGRVARPTLDDLFGDAGGSGPDGATDAADLFAPESDPDATGDEVDAGGGDADPDATEEDSQDAGPDEDFRDLALAAEGSNFDESGHEVTTAPSDADQSETVRIVTEAVTTGSPSREPLDEVDVDARARARHPSIAADGAQRGRPGRGARFGNAPAMRPPVGLSPRSDRVALPRRPPEPPRDAWETPPGGSGKLALARPVGGVHNTDRSGRSGRVGPGPHPGGVAFVHASP